jgi:hypothetical protein
VLVLKAFACLLIILLIQCFSLFKRFNFYTLQLYAIKKDIQHVI